MLFQPCPKGWGYTEETNKHGPQPIGIPVRELSMFTGSPTLHMKHDYLEAAKNRKARGTRASRTRLQQLIPPQTEDSGEKRWEDEQRHGPFLLLWSELSHPMCPQSSLQSRQSGRAEALDPAWRRKEWDQQQGFVLSGTVSWWQ